MAVSDDRSFCTVLHDVAPQTWDRYRSVVAAFDALGLPLTLLVVPNLHRQGRIDHYPAFCRAIDRRLARGDEVVLHGYYHRDEMPMRWSASHWLHRRALTHEAEFYALPAAIAQARLARGVALFARLGWPAHGFVAPGWMAGPDTARQLGQLGFRYLSTFTAVQELQLGRAWPAPVLVWSSGSAGRRRLSLCWNQWRLRRFAGAGCLRLALHPADLDHDLPRRFWLATAGRLATERRALTESAWLDRQPGPMVSEHAMP